MHYSTHQTCALKPQIKLSEWDILSSLPNALVILNAKGRIVWMNPSAEAMLGYGLIDSLWMDVIQKAFLAREDDGHDVSLVDGRRVHIAIASLDSLPGTLITLSDITASRDHEKAKDEEQRLIAIGTMTAQLAHQIRTPLSSAIIYTEHLKNLPGLDAPIQVWISRLQESHANIEEQIHDLLLFAKEAPINPKYTNMEYWCSQLIRRVDPYIKANSALFKIDNLLKIRESSIHSESLIDAILNLVINSLQSQATEINLSLVSIDNSGIQITIADNGKGMSEEIKNQAFLPFYTTKAQGTGLGLAIVFAVVKAHRGKILLESAEGMGTQVTMYLPGDNKCIQ